MSSLLYNVPLSKTKRVILDSDVKNEADDPFAILYALLSPSLDVRGIIATHFGKDRVKDSMERSFEELTRLLEVSGWKGKVVAVKGAAECLQEVEKGYYATPEPICTEGVRLILEEVHNLPCNEKLYIAVLGPLTNVASALLMEPGIAHRLTIVWNGGGCYPDGGMEFNLVNDIVAAGIVLKSECEIWQIPVNRYNSVRVGVAELQRRVLPCKKAGEYLFQLVVGFLEEMEHERDWPRPESLDICDLTAVGVLLEPHDYGYHYQEAPEISGDMGYMYQQCNRPIRIYDSIDGRYLWEDFLAKLQIEYMDAC